MNRWIAIAGAGLAGFTIYQLYLRAQPFAAYVERIDPTEEPPPPTETEEQDTMATAARWTPPAAAGPYLAAIAAAEDANGIPRNMLARLLWQESRFRDDIISGRARSPAGAVGIAQFMPATAAQRRVDPLDPFDSIRGAGEYLAELYRRFGTWAQALAAYNWGQGNVARRGLASVPTETRNYYTSILRDLGLSA